MRIPLKIIVLLVALPGLCLPRVSRAGDTTQPAQRLRVAFTSDTEGHLDACQSCPGLVGLGGLARRATAVQSLRATGPVLLIDAGNAVFGDQTVGSRGAALVAAYDVLGYDVINVCYRDFRYGKDATVQLFGTARSSVVSANLVDAHTGETLFRPYVVKTVGGRRVAVIGLTVAPAGLDVLPRLKRQMSGVGIDPPDAALAKWLPRAKAEAESVILLFYGSPTALARLDAGRLGQCTLVLMGDARPDELPATFGPAGRYAAEQHGRSVTVVTIGGAAPDSRQLPIDATVPRDGAVETVLTKYQAPASDLPVVAVAPKPKSRQPKGLAGVDLTADQVNAAIDRGTAFLWNYIKTEELEKKKQKLGDSPEHVLACLALVHAGAHKRFPEFDRALRGYLAGFTSDQYLTVYQYGLMSMLIEAYGDPAFFGKQRAIAHYLVESEGPGGTWTYSAAIPASSGVDRQGGQPLRVVEGSIAAAAPAEGGMARQSDWSVGKDGDNSCTQFAILGLHAASRCHTATAAEVWTRNLAANRRRQGKQGGWGYSDNDSESPYGSMTCAGLCALAIDRYELGEVHPEIDDGIERGLAWMGDHFAVNTNPEKSSYLYYYLYSLERVGRVLDTEFIGDHEWYPLGARYLLDNQKPDGRWLEPGDPDPRNPSSFALLFLTRATPKLAVEVKHGGPGVLRADIESPPPARLYIILDASGSMIETMDGKQKFDAARDAVSGLVNALPDSVQVALRVYGHRKRSIETGSDEDTALEIPMAVLDRPEFAAKLKSLRARGKTPLALSLTQATADLSDVSASKPATLLLLTDGGEDTMPRRNPVKAAGELARLKGLTFHIVGFDINQEEWGVQLRAMADQAGGHYWPAARPDALAGQITSAIFGRPEGFTVLDAEGRALRQGNFGHAMSLPEGKYQFKTAFAGSEFNAPFAITTDSTTALLFDASRAAASHQGETPLPTSAAPAPNVPKFCTHCGHAIPTGAKFCPSCGQPLSRK